MNAVKLNHHTKKAATIWLPPPVYLSLWRVRIFAVRVPFTNTAVFSMNQNLRTLIFGNVTGSIKSIRLCSMP